ncbi:alpha/beta hydrolase family protein [Streptomyces cahuitamycinicus]|uniref:Peptidase S9 prolyl oligopeptidase catalytic domain-containing protein n=1 Tax=Streptomyces cahuitamycinicus TaxID=2070367 RepID=A0A2N8TXV5_9ACTN|nr:prolyl oligopeptidase family serine peptidase [Streptomyces cahuitamycinicus]PNG23829.1 hypothetical protein C1J00_01765 [Streptomyces cahuitamycinicus]
MRLPEAFFEERRRHLLSWRRGPVFGEVRADGALHITGPGVPDPLRVELGADAVLFLPSREAVAGFHLDGTLLTVLEHRLDGSRHQWTAQLTGAGGWIVLDALEGIGERGETCVVLTLQDEQGGLVLQQVCEEGSVQSYVPLTAGELVHWDLTCDAAVLRSERGPRTPQLRLERPLTSEACTTVTAHWHDGCDGSGALVDEDGLLCIWDLRTGELTPAVQPAGLIDDVRILRDAPTRLFVVATHHGTDAAYICDKATGETWGVDGVSGGRLRIRAADGRGIGLYQFSTLEGSSWLWFGPGRLEYAAGDVGPHRGRASVAHRRLGDTPALVYLPQREPRAVVVSLHGGPESLERDELRWDGLYRDLLAADIAVIGANYAGSLGYGAAHTRRGWRNWARAFAEDLAACREAAAAWGVGPERMALLGGSFGGSLALLGCTLDHRLAGAVASAPMIDVGRHAERAAAAEEAYASWFGERFELGDAREFTAARLARTGAGQRVVVVHGDQDDVTDFRDSRVAVELAQERDLAWTLVAEEGTGHVPSSADRALARLLRVRAGLGHVLETDVLGCDDGTSDAWTLG